MAHLSQRFVLENDDRRIIAEGVVFSDMTTVIHWLEAEHSSTVVWQNVAYALALYGKQGATKIVYID